MRAFFTLIIVLISSCLFAQKSTISPEVLKAIETEIWIPFIQSYNDLDSEKLKSIHSKDIIRVNIDPNTVETGEAYLENFGGFIDHVKSKGEKVAIAFAILTTAIDPSETIAYQTGYYQYSSQRKDESELIIRGYGYFNVTLKKEGDTWKIAVDADKHADITTEEFEAYELLYRLD